MSFPPFDFRLLFLFLFLFLFLLLSYVYFGMWKTINFFKTEPKYKFLFPYFLSLCIDLHPLCALMKTFPLSFFLPIFFSFLCYYGDSKCMSLNILVVYNHLCQAGTIAEWSRALKFRYALIIVGGPSLNPGKG